MKNQIPQITIGVDLGDTKHWYHVLDQAGNDVQRGSIPNTQAALSRLAGEHSGARIAIEVGTHSPWISRHLAAEGCEVFIANARKLRAIYENERKSDELDARMLAKIARLDPELLHPVTQQLQQITGVGPITALAFVLAVEDPWRIEETRDIGAYLGIVPRRDQSGGTDKSLGIFKAGNAYVRKLLVQCAQYILGAHGPDCELRRFGLRLASRGGKAHKKKAMVAVARKLAVLMLSPTSRIRKENWRICAFFRA